MLTLVASCSSAFAQQSRIGRKHLPVEVLRDVNGDPLHTFDKRYVSGNWSGYVLPKFQTNKHYVAAQATWVVPTVTFKGSMRFSSSWVGIGGFCTTMKCAPRHIDQTLIQLGTEQDAISDTQSDYYAWYEMLPEASIPTSLLVNPGDTITASLSCANSCATGDWMLSMTNETTGVTWGPQEFFYASPNESAEVIEEAPFNGGILPLADYHKATFSATMANSKSASLADGVSIVMDDRQPHHRTASSNVSAPSSSHDGFNACFNSTKSLAHCPAP
jgi:hypothetical protein